MRYKFTGRLDIQRCDRLASGPETPMGPSMYILRPTRMDAFGKDNVGTIEEVVRDSRLVDKGIRELKKFSPNAPSFDPERRKFFKHAAVLAGLIASGKFLEACSPAVVEYQGKSYGSWEAWLMSQDLIR